MLAPLTFDEALGILRSHVDPAWLEAHMATPDGYAEIAAIVDLFVELDTRDAIDASALFVRPWGRQVAAPASGATKATTTIAITKTRATPSPITIPAGTKVETPDGHVFTLDNPLSWGKGEAGVAKSTTATALVSGHMGAIPQGEITAFVPIANGLSGVGTDVSVPFVTGGKALRLTTDLTKPHPFKSFVAGLYVQILDVTDSTKSAFVGTLWQAAHVNGSSSSPFTAGAPENAYLWAPVVINSDATYNAVPTGSYGYTWVARDWAELGFAVTNTTAVVDGVPGFLDEIANARGRPRLVGEGDDSVRARLLRAPEPPTSTALLHKAVVALAPYNATRHDVTIYEIGIGAPSSVDPLAANCPIAMGFIGDLHVGDNTDAFTPDAVASADANYNATTPFVNPGFSCACPPYPFVVIVRWDPPAGMPSDQQSAANGALWKAENDGRQPGCFLQLYNTSQWGF